MKKYLILSLLFLFAITPAFAKNINGASQQGQAANSQNTNVTVTPSTSVTPTGNQVKTKIKLKQKMKEKISSFLSKPKKVNKLLKI